MQSVSAAWKQNQKLDLRSESFVEITYRVLDNAAQEDATLATNGNKPYSDLISVVDGLEKTGFKYATCAGLWILDGTCDIIPDSAPYGSIGYVSSARCGANGRFATNPVCTIYFSQTVTTAILGITITFSSVYGEYAKRFIVKSYNGTTLLSNKTFSNSEVQTAIDFETSGYDKITIEIIEWSGAGHNARIDDMLLGVVQTYNKSDITKYSHSMEVDPISTGLPKQEVKFSIDNVDGRFNPLNRNGAGRYLIERQEMDIKYGYIIDGSLEWIDGATLWLAEWDTPTNGVVASFTLKSLFDFMQDTYSGTLSDTLYNIAVAALTQANLPTTESGENRWSIDSSLQDISVNITDDYDHTIAETLQLIANAACCVLYQDRRGVVRIEPHTPSLAANYDINLFNSYKNGNFELLQPLLYVNVNDGMYETAAGLSGEIQSIDNPFIQNVTVATAVGSWVAAWLNKRTSISGEYRSDPRLDCLDGVKSENKYALTPLLITSLSYSFNGAFKAKYVGRVYNEVLTPLQIPMGTTYLGGQPTWVFPL